MDGCTVQSFATHLPTWARRARGRTVSWLKESRDEARVWWQLAHDVRVWVTAQAFSTSLEQPPLNLMASAAAVSMTHTRWLAYDDASRSADSNVETEPGAARHSVVGWSEVRTQPCTWVPLQQGEKPSPSTSLPHRTLIVDIGGADPLHVEHEVALLPAAFLEWPSHMNDAGKEASSARRAAAVERVWAALVQADQQMEQPQDEPAAAPSAGSSSSMMASYLRFRWLWLLARDWTPLQAEENLLLLERHANLHAPVHTHNMRKLAERMQQLVVPASVSAEAAAGSASSVSAASNPAPSSSRYFAVLRASAGRVGLLPEAPLVADPSTASGDDLGRAVLRTLIHAQACATLGWDLDSRNWTPEAFVVEEWERGLDAAAEAVQAWVVSHLAQRRRYVEFLARAYRAWMPPRSFLVLLSQCLPFDWRDPCFQAVLVRAVLRDGLATAWPLALEYRYGFWRGLLGELEGAQVDIDDELAAEVQNLLQQKTKETMMQHGDQSLVAASSHWTVSYPDKGSSDSDSGSAVVASSARPPLRTLTLRLGAGFGSVTGLTLWPAGFLMCEYILACPERFRGKRVLELGVGIGMTAILLHRAGVSTLVCTDCDDPVLENLRVNLRINDVPVHAPLDRSSDASSLLAPGVYVERLSWTEDYAELLARTQADLVLACDTIYLPEVHDALAGVVRAALEPPAADSSASASASAPESEPRAALFAQVCRNPTNFALYEAAFAKVGMSRLEELPVDEESVPLCFAYDRDCIRFQQHTLQ